MLDSTYMDNTNNHAKVTSRTHWLCDMAKEVVEIEKKFKQLISTETDNQQARKLHSKTMVDQSQTIGMSRNLSARYPPTKGSKFMSTPKN